MPAPMKCHLRLLVLDTNVPLLSDFFSVRNGMVQPTCEKLAMLLQQGVQFMYLCMDNVGENQNLAKKMKAEKW